MPAFARRVGEVDVDVEERGPRDVTGEVQLAPALGCAELPAAVDELVVHAAIVSVATSGYNETRCAGGFWPERGSCSRSRRSLSPPPVRTPTFGTAAGRTSSRRV